MSKVSQLIQLLTCLISSLQIDWTSTTMCIQQIRVKEHVRNHHHQHGDARTLQRYVLKDVAAAIARMVEFMLGDSFAWYFACLCGCKLLERQREQSLQEKRESSCCVGASCMPLLQLYCEGHGTKQIQTKSIRFNHQPNTAGGVCSQRLRH